MSTLQTHKTIAEIFGIWAGIAGAFIGGGFAAAQYLEAKQDQRVARVMEFRNEFQSENLINARKEIAAAWSDLTGLDEAARSDAAYREYALQKDRPVIGYIIDVAEFYDSLAICIRSGLCDSNTALDFFGAESVRFFQAHYHMIADIQVAYGTREFGTLMSEFAKQ